MSTVISTPASDISRGIDARADSRAFRDALGRYPTGVALVTASSPGGPVGMAVNSFTSVSLAPPLISFCAMLTSTSWAGIRAAGSFAVSVLNQDHEPLARAFTRRDVDRFAGHSWQLSPGGHPVLTESLSWFDATIQSVTVAGDHEVVIAQVHACSAPQPGDPLVFYGGRYGNLAREGALAQA